MKWAFSDESRRGSAHVVASVIVETHEVNAVRTELRGFLRRNQRRLHMAKESSARRSQFLALVERQAMSAVAVVVPLGFASMDEARARALAAMTGLLIENGVAMWHLEWMTDQVQDRDRRAIAAAVAAAGAAEDFRYDHRPPAGEPLLWAADAVAWASSRKRLAWVATTTLA